MSHVRCDSRNVFYFQGHLSLGIIWALLVANCDTAHTATAARHESSHTSQQKHKTEEAQDTKRRLADSTRDIEVAESQFVPSFGPPHHPQRYFASLGSHTSGTSPILAYSHMYSSGHPYACTFPYYQHVLPFVLSPPESHVPPHHPTIPHYPYGNARLPYAEEYLHYLPRGVSHDFAVNLPSEGFYPSFYRHTPDRSPFLELHQPPVQVRPHNNPHVFHSVVNYGYSNLHHGDHFEPHHNGRTIPHRGGK
jgi:hypothetical protein